MANKNRTELKAETDSDLQPVLQLEDHKDFLKDDFIESALFRKDVIDTIVQVGGIGTADFNNFDFITFSSNANLTLTISNVFQGEIKYLKITKNPADTLTFSGATDESINPDFVKEKSTIYYMVYNKDGGTILLKPIVRDVGSATIDLEGITERATDIEAQEGDTVENRFLTPGSGQYVFRRGTHFFVDSSNYLVADRIGFIVPNTGNTNGTIRMPDPSNFSGHKIVINTATVVTLEIVQFDTSNILFVGSDRFLLMMCDGNTWIAQSENALP